MALRFDEIQLANTAHKFYPKLQGAGSSQYLRVQTQYGYLDLGPNNGDYAHFNTDRGSYYFNKGLSISGNIASYSGTTSASFAIYYDSADTNYYCDPNGQSRLSTLNLGSSPTSGITSGYIAQIRGSMHMTNNNIDYVNQLHFHDNVRFYDNGDDSYLNFKFGDTSHGGIKMIDGDNNLHGYFYADGDDSIGILDADGNWAVQVDKDTLTGLKVNDVYRLKADTSKVLLGAAAATDKVQVTGHFGIGGNTSYPKIAYPGTNALWSDSGSSTGQIVIDLPGTLANYDMMYMEVDIYEYSSAGATKLIIGGHNWNSGGNSGTSNQMWHNINVQVVGALTKPIYLGWRNDGSNNRRVIAIGETNSAWYYATVHVAKVHGAEFYGTGIDWVGDWNIAQTTSGSYFTKSPTTNWNDGGSYTLETNGIIEGNHAYGTTSVRSPIFYDLDDTSYYVNPASTSNINNLTINGTLSGAGSFVPVGGGTFDGDVTFTGASHNLMWDKSENRLEFWDNAHLSFGDPGGTPDLLIYHDGSNSYIKEQGTGSLIIDASTLKIARNIVSNSTYNLVTMYSTRTIDDYGANINKDYMQLNLVTPGADTDGGGSAHGYGAFSLKLANSGSNNDMAEVLNITQTGDATFLRDIYVNGGDVRNENSSSTKIWTTYNGTEYWGGQASVDYWICNTSCRAPKFIDTNNTAYYVDPAGTSSMNDIELDDYIVHKGDTNTYFGFNGADSWKLHVGGGDRLIATTSELTSNLAFNTTTLKVDSKKLLDMPSNSTQRGPWNPIASAVRGSGTAIYGDEDFVSGSNSVSVYNNQGGTGVQHVRENDDTTLGQTAPNSSGIVIRVVNNGNNTSPGRGGFYQTISSSNNQTFVQVFQAKLESGKTFEIAENAQGSNNTSYWLTNNAGTGKFEWYVRVSHCGDSGSFSSGGHVYVNGGSANEVFTWYLASSEIYKITDAQTRRIQRYIAKNRIDSPVYYDADNTAFYVDPAGTSDVNKFRLGTTSNLQTSSSKLDVLGIAAIRNNSDSAATLYVQNHSSTADTIQPYIFLADSGGNRGGLGVTTSNALVTLNGQGGLSFKTGASGVGGTQALLLDTSQNAIFTGNVISKDTFYLENGSGNRWQMLFDTNAFNLRYYNGSSWSADAFAIDTSNNAIFAAEITSGDDINTPTKVVIGESATAEVRLKKTDAGTATVSYYSDNTQKAYDQLDADEHVVRYVASNSVQKIYGSGSERLRISGDVIVQSATDFAVQAGRAIRFDGMGHTYIKEETDNVLKIYAGGIEHMAIGGGDIFCHKPVQVESYIYHIGDTNTNMRFETSQITIRTAGDSHIQINNDENIYFRTAMVNRFKMDTSGNFIATADIIAYGSVSDVSYKENIKPITGALNLVDKLQGVTFDWKEDTDTNKMVGIKEDIGFIAQDVEKVLPTLVRENENGKLSIRDKGIVPVLVEAIKELKAEIEELKKQIK